METCRRLDLVARIGAWMQVGVGIGVGFGALATPGSSATAPSVLVGIALIVMSAWSVVLGNAGRRSGASPARRLLLAASGFVVLGVGIWSIVVPAPTSDVLVTRTGIAFGAAAVGYAVVALTVDDRGSRWSWGVLAVALAAFGLVLGAGPVVVDQSALVVIAAVFVELSLVTAAAMLLAGMQRPDSPDRGGVDSDGPG